jgi:hypothetical protein
MFQDRFTNRHRDVTVESESRCIRALHAVAILQAISVRCGCAGISCTCSLGNEGGLDATGNAPSMQGGIVRLL